jgi:nitrate reductase gamma subunit
MAAIVWIGAPYIAFASFIWGHRWRWRLDRFRSGVGGRAEISQTGLWLLRIGLLVALLPRMSEMVLHRADSGLAADVSRVLAGSEIVGAPIALVGAILVLLPDLVEASAHPVTILDRVTLPILATTLITGAVVAFDPNNGATTTLFVWFPSLFSLHPDGAAMVHAPFMDQARGVMIVLTIAVWPYTRLCGILFCPIERAVRHGEAALARRRKPLESVMVAVDHCHRGGVRRSRPLSVRAR